MTGQARQLDLRQRALKMTANALYGCLGSPFGRYPAIHLAAAIAALGRALLNSTQALVEEKFPVSVIYGDTDSLMVDTGMTDLDEAMALSDSILDAVNADHREVRLKLEAVFDRILIVGKKMYAARCPFVPGLQKSELVVRGMFGGRRGNPSVVWPMFRSVLETVFSDTPRDAQAAQVSALLSAFSASLQSRALSALSASRVLGRDVDSYVAPPPVVAVAARLNAQGHAIGAGDAIEVVVCGDASQGSTRDRLCSLAEAEAQGLKADLDYVKDAFAMPAVRQVTTAAKILDVCSVAVSLDLPAASYVFAAPKPRRILKNFGLRDPCMVKIPPVSLSCKECSSSIPLNADGFNRDAEAFTLERCPNVACSWEPYKRIPDITAQVLDLANQQVNCLGQDKFAPSVAAMHASLTPPRENSNLWLHCSYVEVQVALQDEMERQWWGHEDLSAAFSVGQRIVEQHESSDANTTSMTVESDEDFST